LYFHPQINAAVGEVHHDGTGEALPGARVGAVSRPIVEAKYPKFGDFATYENDESISGVGVGGKFGRAPR
jgi:hypothetical protein